MSQSEILAGALLGMFVIYLLMTNRLAAYWALLTGGGTSAASASTGGTTAGPAQTSAGQGSMPGTSTTQQPGFVPQSVQQFGNVWVWKDAHTGATVIQPNPPPGYTPPAAVTGQ